MDTAGEGIRTDIYIHQLSGDADQHYEEELMVTSSEIPQEGQWT